ncbi:LCP family protein [Spirillospora sp. NPDC047279]|uniref:LCP family protein n=1 Tax=Spirillospora sp. NPDC047279 TaxID=3155478 RepID=UPI0033E48A5F
MSMRRARRGPSNRGQRPPDLGLGTRGYTQGPSEYGKGWSAYGTRPPDPERTPPPQEHSHPTAEYGLPAQEHLPPAQEQGWAVQEQGWAGQGQGWAGQEEAWSAYERAWSTQAPRPGDGQGPRYERVARAEAESPYERGPHTYGQGWSEDGRGIPSYGPGVLDYRQGTPRRGRRGRARWLVAAGVVMLGLASTGGYAAYTGLDGNIRHVSADDLGARPAKRTKAENFLVVGSDSRDGANARYGREAGARTDTMVLFHVPANGQNVRAISLPRDSMVRIPSCSAPDGSALPAQTAQINSAFNTAGLTCAWKTVEATTGVRVDHVMEIDFSGFKGMVDALGGVDLTVPRAISDPKARLRLAAGRQRLNGEQALAYARVRYSVGDGSDLSRIKRQQQLMRAMATRAKAELTNPRKLYAFLEASTKSITTDPGLGLRAMFDLARSMGDPSTMTFVTVPVRPYPADPNRVQWTEPAAQRLFASLR